MIALMLAAAMAQPMPAPVSAAAPIAGVWHNPRGSVAVRTGDCGGGLCGWIVRASDEAQADARDAGVPRLIGTTLLQDYRPIGRNRWSGRVYVPDMGRSFGSTITLVDADTIAVKGCVVGGFLCKTQTWHRG